MKKKIRRTLLFLVLSCTAVAAAFVINIYATTPKLDKNKLNYIDYSLTILDKDEKPINFSLTESEAYYVKLDTLPEFVKQSFILAEDKNFYSHSGVDTKRIAGAIINNILHPDSIQGASTITQQLIKNTHLSPDKSIKRKIQEVRLARKLEKSLSKEEILESYLNTIYFGNKAYGIEKAAKIYFNKHSSALTPAEAATLAATIKGPSIYSPTADIEKCTVRRNYILTLLKDHSVINEAEFTTAINTKIDTSKVSQENLYKNAYCDATVAEAAELLSKKPTEIYQSGIKIYTYLDTELQKNTEKLIYGKKYTAYNEHNKAADSAAIIVDNATLGVSVLAARGSENLYTMRRQPGSCVKPALVYVPALEQKLITPYTFLYDAKTQYGNYTPANYMDRYYGWVSAKRAVEMSLNSPAVALFQMTGIEKSKQIAQKNGIKFHEKDDGLALGLGGFTYGVTIPELAASYSTFANNGKHQAATFIKKIEDSNGKILYKNDIQPTVAMRSDTAYLMTDILRGVVENGTATRLKGLGYEVAAKSGTVGVENGTENTDAWLMSFTTSHTVGIWYGAPQGKEQRLTKSVTGGSLAEIAKEVFDNIKTENKPAKFSCPDSVRKVNIDLVSLGKNKVELAADITPDHYKQVAYFSVFNMPSKIAESPYNLIPLTLAG